eukprot:6574753-Ditylum_brightwellii.AAC.1
MKAIAEIEQEDKVIKAEYKNSRCNESNENGSSKKNSKKRRKLCHGNTSRGGDGFNKIHTITRSDKESAENHAEKSKKERTREINQIQCVFQLMEDHRKNVANMQLKDPTTPPYFEISEHTHHE